MGDTDPEKLADRLEHEADELERRSEELGQRTEDVAHDWERKREDESVPGAPPPAGHDDDGPPTGAPTGKDADS
jgi:hypothetical protein